MKNGKTSKLKIENRAVAELVPYARNAKLHSEAQVDAIANRIQRFGFNNPVLVGADGGIIAGHGRVLAAKKLGLVELPCIPLGHLSAEEKRAYILADNRLGETGGGWDAELLEIELAELEEFEFSADDLGFAEESLLEFGIGEEEDSAQNGSKGTQEVDVDGFALECKCPRCGMEFDPKNEKA